MGFFSKIGKALKKVAPVIAQFVPGGSTAVQAFSAVRSAGEDRRKLALAQKANLQATGSMPLTSRTRLVRPPAKLRAPSIAVTSAAGRKREAIRGDQALAIKAGKVSLERQKMLAEEWDMLGKPGTFKEYLMDQVRSGAVQ